MIKKLLLPLFLFFSYIISYSQDFSNKGKDFWLGYGATEKMYSDNSQDQLFSFNNPNAVAANVTISIPNTSFTALTYVVPPNSVFTTPSNIIPKSGVTDARLINEGNYNTGIHITSDQPIVVYTHAYTNQVYAASVLFPTNTLGREYTSLNFTQRANFDQAKSWVFVVAVQDSTVIQVVPSAPTVNHPAGVAFYDTLNKGQILNLLGASIGHPNLYTGQDLTGTTITSVSFGATGCKPLAVFCGSSKITIDCDNGSNGSADNLYQQMFPRSAWGLKYIVVPTLGLPRNYYRVLVGDPTTVVKVNGVTQAGLVGNTYYQYFNAAQTIDVISADKPIMVAQYMTTHGECNNPGSNGDPEMIYLSSVQQTIDTVSVVSSPLGNTSGRQHFLNVVLKTNTVNSFKLDGATQVASFFQVPFDPTYSYAQFTVAQSVHTMTSDSGFNATAYGIAGDESYGYNAGTNVKDLYQGFNLINLYGTGTASSACRGSQFFMRVTLPYQATSITWDFSNNPNLSPNANITQNNPVPDSSYVINGRTLYRFKLPTPYVYNTIGSFPVKITAFNPTPDGCTGLQQFSFNVNVVQGPKADFSFTNTSGCLAPIQFTDLSNGNGSVLSQWLWDFGDASTSAIQNPLHTYATGGIYTAKLRAINASGCYADTIKVISLSSVPVAGFNAPATGCINVAATFTNTSTIQSGTITQWQWNFGDGSAIVNAVNGNAQSHAFTAAGTYTVTLKVTSSTGCQSATFPKTIIINPNPTVDFSFTNSGCAKDSVYFASITNGGPGTTYLWNFGDATSSALANPAKFYAASGTYSVQLNVTTAAGCSASSAIKPVTVAPTLASPVVTTDTVTASTIRFKWAAVPGAIAYKVSVDNGVTFIDPSSGANGLTHTISGLAPNTTINIIVKAIGQLVCQNNTGNGTGMTVLPDVGIFIPNTFTPNGDGKNDLLKVYGNYIKSMNMKIFNQWGQLIFQTSDLSKGWDGTYNGKPQPLAVYLYVVNVVMQDGRQIKKSGSVNLIR